MKSKMNIKSIVMMATVGIISLFFINMSLAANTGKVRVETANLRETAEESAKILEQLSEGDKVEIIQKTGNWYQVKAKQITGYVRQDLITVSGEIAKNNTTETNQVAQNEVKTEVVEEPKTEEVTQNNEVNNNQAEQKTETEEKDLNLGKQKVTENTKLKIVPVINATDIIEVKKEEEVNVVEIVNGWACVETQTTKGWIRKEKLAKQEEKVEQEQQEQQPPVVEQPKVVSKTLYVNSASINVRKAANKSAEVVTSLSVNTAVEVLEEANGWSKVKVNGEEGYILSTLLSSKKQETSRSSSMPRTSNSSSTSTASGNGSSVVGYAKQFIGTKYTYGGTSPSTGFDCSGFTSYVYRNFGVSLPRTSGGQAGAGVAVSRSNLVAGDLIIYSGHVAIYVGGGQVIHAPRPGKSVCIVPINQAASNYLGARRVL